MIRGAVLIAGALFTTTAAAGEKWSAESGFLGIGHFEYVQDIGDTVVLSWTSPSSADQPLGYFYFPGLAGGNFGGRGYREGYWVFPGKGKCPALMTAPNGLSSSAWGRTLIVFHDPPPPTAWTMLIGGCFGDWDFSVTASPLPPD